MDWKLWSFFFISIFPFRVVVINLISFLQFNPYFSCKITVSTLSLSLYTHTHIFTFFWWIFVLSYNSDKGWWFFFFFFLFEYLFWYCAFLNTLNSVVLVEFWFESIQSFFGNRNLSFYQNTIYMTMNLNMPTNCLSNNLL